MKKGMKLLSLMLALSLLFALAACGTTGTGDEPSTEAAQSSSPGQCSRLGKNRRF